MISHRTGLNLRCHLYSFCFRMLSIMYYHTCSALTAGLPSPLHSTTADFRFTLTSPFTLTGISWFHPSTTLWKYIIKATTLAHRFLTVLIIIQRQNIVKFTLRRPVQIRGYSQQKTLGVPDSPDIRRPLRQYRFYYRIVRIVSGFSPETDSA